MSKYEINLFENIVHIKNYERIYNISDTCIQIKLKDKKIKINGTSLIIIKLDEYEICIKGTCKNIEFYE